MALGSNGSNRFNIILIKRLDPFGSQFNFGVFLIFNRVEILIAQTVRDEVPLAPL